MTKYILNYLKNDKIIGSSMGSRAVKGIGLKIHCVKLRGFGLPRPMHLLPIVLQLTQLDMFLYLFYFFIINQIISGL